MAVHCICWLLQLLHLLVLQNLVLVGKLCQRLRVL
jgi:hypothetical protein